MLALNLGHLPRTLRLKKYCRRIVLIRTPFSSETISSASPPSDFANSEEKPSLPLAI
jgi:hypothetical protein